jgi:pyruvate/2-oxoglutarate dehydrogenase complex dihydrolipoamide acyltransferase (E2) component
MSDDLKFSIQRTRALVLAGCFAAVSVLLFFAGMVTGLLYSGTHAKTTLIVSAPTAPARPHGAPDKTPEAPTDAAATSSTASTPDEPTPSSTAPAATAAAAAPPSISPAPSSAAAATPKTPPPPAATTTDAAKPASEQASDTASETPGGSSRSVLRQSERRDPRPVPRRHGLQAAGQPLHRRPRPPVVRRPGRPLHPVERRLTRSRTHLHDRGCKPCHRPDASIAL